MLSYLFLASAQVLVPAQIDRRQAKRDRRGQLNNEFGNIPSGRRAERDGTTGAAPPLPECFQGEGRQGGLNPGLLPVRKFRQRIDLSQQETPQPLRQNIAGSRDNPIDDQGKVARSLPVLAQQVFSALMKKAQQNQTDEVEIVDLANERKKIRKKIERSQDIGQCAQQEGLLSDRDTRIPQEAMEELREARKKQEEVTQPRLCRSLFPGLQGLLRLILPNHPRRLFQIPFQSSPLSEVVLLCPPRGGCSPWGLVVKCP